MQLSEEQGLEIWRHVAIGMVVSDAPDMTARQQAILLTVVTTDGPHTVRGLAAGLEIAKPAVTRGIDTLVKLGFVRRKKDQDDKRSVFIERTPAGLGHVRRLSRLIARASAKAAEEQRPVAREPEEAAPPRRAGKSAAA